VELLALTARLVLAGVFLLAGATKLIDPLGFRKTLSDFGIAPVLARPAVVLVPLLEVAVAVALIPVSLAWSGAWGALGLLSIFCLAAALAVLRERRPKCHCFGQLHSTPIGRSTWIRNAALAMCAVWLISRGPLHPGLNLWTWFASTHGPWRRVAIVFICFAAFGFIRILERARPVSEALALQSAADANDDDDDELPQARPAPVRRSRRRPPPPVPQAESSFIGPGASLAIGMPAPEFELPAVNGEKRSLRALRDAGRDVLLVFTSPHCKACMMLASNMLRWMHEMAGFPSVVFISTGSREDNLARLHGFEPGQVLLQRYLEVSHAYDCTSTPSAILVGADGAIRSSLVVGSPAIEQLLTSRSGGENSETVSPVGSAPQEPVTQLPLPVSGNDGDNEMQA